MITTKKLSQASYVTPDLSRLTEYYRRVLGLTLVAEEEGRTYLGSTVDHHSIVLTSGSAPLCSGLGFQLGADEDLDTFEQQLVAHGVKVTR